MPRRIFYDGLNLGLQHGTGVATYGRTLVHAARDLGHETGIVYSVPQRPARDPLLREVAFFDARRRPAPRLARLLTYAIDHLRCYRPLRPVPLPVGGAVLRAALADRLPTAENLYLSRNLFLNAAVYFHATRRFARLAFEQPPDVFHWTYPLPLRADRSANIYTIHDLVPLRLPFTTLDRKRHIYRVLKALAARADHIVTVSENSRRDIIELLGVDERRVTNTGQTVAFPAEDAALPDDAVAEQIAGSFGLDYRNYLLFFGALEPKKNVARLIEAYLGAPVDLPLVLVAGDGWSNAAERAAIARQNAQDAAESARTRRRILHFEHLNRRLLVLLVRGARAVLAPSLYEGFGLPVLEAMTLGTPVVTSNVSSLPEVAGDAALFVNPYDTNDIARAIRTIAADADLCAELVRRGLAQARKFSPERYRERLKNLYESLA